MSNAGKTYWSKKLEANGFIRYGCDEMIENKLGPQLKKLGFKGIKDVAKWMGQPYEKQHKKNSLTYLDFEKQIMREILSNIKQMDLRKNVVIDTTGSVIYTGDDILNMLSESSIIVYLTTPASVKKIMYENYIKNPKPVFWGDVFSKRKGETNLQALSRCYPELLSYRQKKYQQYAKITLDYSGLRKNISTDKFISFLSS
jgi:shikimate kinase